MNDSILKYDETDLYKQINFLECRFQWLKTHILLKQCSRHPVVYIPHSASYEASFALDTNSTDVTECDGFRDGFIQEVIGHLNPHKHGVLFWDIFKQYCPR